MIRIEHNVETDEIIEIELSAEEETDLQKQYAEAQAKAQVQQIEAEAKAAARQAILDRLSLTEEEARLLLG